MFRKCYKVGVEDNTKTNCGYHNICSLYVYIDRGSQGKGVITFCFLKAQTKGTTKSWCGSRQRDIPSRIERWRGVLYQGCVVSNLGWLNKVSWGYSKESGTMSTETISSAHGENHDQLRHKSDVPPNQWLSRKLWGLSQSSWTINKDS